MKHKLVMVMLSVALIVSLALTACIEPAAPPEEPDGGVTPTPEPAGPEYEWKWQSLFHPGLEFDLLSQGTADQIELMSGGRIKITVFTGGTLCPNKEMHVALGKGQFEMATNCGAYVAGTIPIGYIEFTAPGGPRNLEEFEMFFWTYGFYELLEEAYNEIGIHYISPNVMLQRNIISTKPIRTLDDLKGLKIRATGLDAKLLERLGASPTYLDVSEIYTGLALGTIDASLYGAPPKHWEMKLMEVAKYEILPDVEASVSNTLINLELWNSLPDDLKMIIETASRYQAIHRYYAIEGVYRECMEKMEEEDYGVEFITLPDSDVAKMRAVGWEVLKEVGEENARCAKAIELMEDVMEYYRRRYAAAYGD